MSMFYGKSYYKWIVLLVCILVYSSGNLVRLNYTGIASYIMGEWNIGKPELGILGSVFFYAYALGQGTCGTLTDLLGGRKVIPLGIGITAILVAAFAFADSFNQAVIIRGALGFVGAVAFVPCVAVIGRWFSKKQRGLAMNLFSGPGGGMGEVWSFLLLPVMALFMKDGFTILGVGSWRAATLIMAVIILVVAAVSYAFLRSDPSEMGLESIQAKEEKKSTQDSNYKSMVLSAIKDPSFWVIILIWQGFTVGLRLLPSWLPLYAATFYTQVAGMDKSEAMIAGGVIASCYVAGRIVGPPLVGKLSDYLLEKYEIPRASLLVVSFTITFGLVYLLTTPLTSPVILGAIAAILGVGINLLSILNTVIAENWSLKTSGTLNGFINTITQLIGAASLTYSGYMAVQFAVKGGGFHLEYQGIWFLLMISIGIAIVGSIYTLYNNRKQQNTKTSIQG